MNFFRSLLRDERFWQGCGTIVLAVIMQIVWMGDGDDP